MPEILDSGGAQALKNRGRKKGSFCPFFFVELQTEIYIYIYDYLTFFYIYFNI